MLVLVFIFKTLPGYFTLGRRLAPPAHGISQARLVFRVLPGAPRLTPPSQRGPKGCPPQWGEVGFYPDRERERERDRQKEKERETHSKKANKEERKTNKARRAQRDREWTERRTPNSTSEKAIQDKRKKKQKKSKQADKQNR